MRWLLLGCFVVACGSKPGSGSERAFCANLGKQCVPDDFTSKDIDDCSHDLPKIKPQLGDDYGKLLTCGAEAKTCAEAIGCLAGAAESFGVDALEQFDRGYRKTRGRARADSPE
jgi:hypothetical protein